MLGLALTWSCTGLVQVSEHVWDHGNNGHTLFRNQYFTALCGYYIHPISFFVMSPEPWWWWVSLIVMLHLCLRVQSLALSPLNRYECLHWLWPTVKQSFLGKDENQIAPVYLYEHRDVKALWQHPHSGSFRMMAVGSTLGAMSFWTIDFDYSYSYSHEIISHDGCLKSHQKVTSYL